MTIKWYSVWQLATSTTKFERLSQIIESQRKWGKYFLENEMGISYRDQFSITSFTSNRLSIVRFQSKIFITNSYVIVKCTVMYAEVGVTNPQRWRTLIMYIPLAIHHLEVLMLLQIISSMITWVIYKG